MLSQLFSNTVYVRVSTNRLHLKHIESGNELEVEANLPFTTEEMTDGGLSQVEDRALREVATAAGASRVAVWTGHILRDDEVKEKLSAK